MAAPKDKAPYLVALTLDFETGSLKCQDGACTQLAVHATRLDTFERLDTFAFYISPYYKKQIGNTKKRKALKSKYDEPKEELMDYTDGALEYSHITMDMLYKDGKDISYVAEELVQFIIRNTPEGTSKSGKPFFIGQNVLFDIGFLQQMMEYTGLMKEFSKYVRGNTDFYGNFQPLVLDTIVLGQLALSHLPNIDSYNLEIMCGNLDVELDDAHDADADVTATTNVVSVLTQRMRSVGGEMSGGLVISKAEKSRKHFKI